MAKITITLSEDIKGSLERQAARYGISVSRLAQKYLEAGLLEDWDRDKYKRWADAERKRRGA